MNPTTAPLSTTTTTTEDSATGGPATPTGLRNLHLLRAAVSLTWVGLVTATSGSLVSNDEPTAIAAVLLVLYPLWDAVATLLERRVVGAGRATRTSTLTVALGVTAAVAMVVAVTTTLGSALLVFGAWALLAGALQLTVALQRHRTVGTQWPNIVSGGISVLAGATIASSSGSADSGLGTLAGYAAFGAFWFLVSAAALTLRSVRAAR